MVWGLFPIESLPGDQRYFIFSKGTYKIGRKGCDVIVNTDKGVSRIHAEVVVNSMISTDPLQKRSNTFSSNVRIKDCSKYGTFLNKNLGSKTKIHEYPNREATIKDGDLISFGTGNATYRFCFVPLIFFAYCLKPYEMDRSLQEEILSIGARSTHSWTVECTHVLVLESMPIKEDLLDAIVAQKPVVLQSWVKAVAEKSICTDIPTYAAYIPTLLFEGLAVKIVDPKVRETCLTGYAFLLGVDLYKFDDRLRSLLNVCGAKILSVDEFCSSNQTSEDAANNNVVLVIPVASPNQFNHIHHLRSLPRVNEMNLVSAVLSGHLDPSVVESAPLPVSSSCSTDETIVADSDVEEVDMVASHRDAATVALKETRKDECEEEISGHHVNTKKEKNEIPNLMVEDGGGLIERRIKNDNSETLENRNSDVLYSQDLVVRERNMPTTSVHSTTSRGVVNFKCFKKKRESQSGNSFGNLIPFSKHPYMENDMKNEVAEDVKEEKKRKKMEAIAEDLFKNEKPRRRAVSGSSLHGLLTRG